ncbi:hypothetical protein OBBRIDRAFT_796772 [Obba rivulosa]|uniref:G3BP-like protein n=1 Tax=Obba rivulosa TaxID=1052685 RepID=A0A8E2ALJ6_9APHY|nr:hypothetical protein OBBRIDRAFT_796772 [Obba rivulosa]
MTNPAPAVNPSEVGWQFVPQYYTFVNKQPNRLHCFYTKSSTFIHGTEGEDGKPCYGQQEIHNKITSIGFQDCKVFIHSVDAQSSANGGILIQVIGEMSNKGEQWRKFVQSFFLAEQPNGYFVLNDIFRFLKEETVEDEEQATEPEPASKPTAPAQEPEPAPPAPQTPAPSSPVELQPEPAPTPTPVLAKPVEEPPAPPAPAPEPEQQQPNGHAPEPKAEPAPSPAIEQSPSPAPEPPATASPPPVSPPASQQRLAPSPAPVQPQQQPPAPAPAPAAPTPSAPPQARRWADLAAKDSNKWGANVAQEVRGTSQAPPPSSASPVPLSGPQSPAPHVTTRPTVPREVAAPQVNVTTPQCFVKSVTEQVSDAALKTTLQARFGPIKELEIVRSKACAFLEFTHLESAKKAIAASLPVPQGGEGGIRVESENGAVGKVIVETRKERGERPPPRGPPVNGEMRRGGFRGRGGPPGGRGRGAPQK